MVVIIFAYYAFVCEYDSLTKSEREYGSNSVTYWVYVYYLNIYGSNNISATRSSHREANGRYRKSFLFCFTIVRTMEVFHREIWYNRLVEHDIKLLCRYSLTGP